MGSRAVFVHGSGGGGWEWLMWGPLFEDAGYEVVNPDLLPVNSLEMTSFRNYVDQVSSWCLPGDVLIGASMGGLLALKAAETFMPRALVLVNAVPPSGFLLPEKEVSEVIAWSKGSLEETRRSMPDSPEMLIKLAHSMWRDDSGKVMREMAAGIPVKTPECPVLAIVANEDEYFPAHAQLETARLVGATVLRYEGMSHLGPLLGNHSITVANDVLKWLQDSSNSAV